VESIATESIATESIATESIATLEESIATLEESIATLEESTATLEESNKHNLPFNFETHAEYAMGDKSVYKNNEQSFPKSKVKYVGNYINQLQIIAYSILCNYQMLKGNFVSCYVVSGYVVSGYFVAPLNNSTNNWY
jgi:hypothetical protein